MTRRGSNAHASRRLRWMADAEALITYRAAFKAGTLASAHRDVVRSVYQLATDELLDQARTAKRAGRLFLALWLTTAGGVAVDVGLFGGNGRGILTDSLLVLFGLGAVTAYEEASTLTRVARMLTPAPHHTLPPSRRELSSTVRRDEPNDSGVTTTS